MHLQLLLKRSCIQSSHRGNLQDETKSDLSIWQGCERSRLGHSPSDLSPELKFVISQSCMNPSNFLEIEVDLRHCLMKTLFYFAIVIYSFTEET